MEVVRVKGWSGGSLGVVEVWVGSRGSEGQVVVEVYGGVVRVKG